MVASLVLICHSAKLAEGLRQLVEQVAQGRVPVFATGGLDEEVLGSNPDQIAALLARADNPEGVLVLMDLGSSVMATEMVLDQCPPERKSRVLLCEAALVEGAVAAAAQLAAGAPLQEAADEARKSLEPKAAQLRATPRTAPPTTSVADTDFQRTLTVTHPLGLHARPAALFVRTAKRFHCEIRVQHGARKVDAKSITGILTLGANQGAIIAVTAHGTDAAEAVAALQSLVNGDFSPRH